MNKTENSFSDTLKKVVTEIHQLANSLLNSEQFIQKVVSIVHNHFNLYSANLFLVEDSRKWAILRASTGELSQKALERGHKLAIDGPSLVGQVIRSGKGMIALDIANEEQDRRFWSAILPLTHSELAVPIGRATPGVIGVLDVQSSEYNAFDVAEMIVFQSIADEIASILESSFSGGKAA